MTASKPQPSLAPRRASAAFMLAHPAHAIALGFGSGLSPFAPGTVGTLWGWMSFLVLMPWLSAAPLPITCRALSMSRPAFWPKATASDRPCTSPAMQI